MDICESCKINKQQQKTYTAEELAEIIGADEMKLKEWLGNNELKTIRYYGYKLRKTGEGQLCDIVDKKINQLTTFLNILCIITAYLAMRAMIYIYDILEHIGLNLIVSGFIVFVPTVIGVFIALRVCTQYNGLLNKLKQVYRSDRCELGQEYDY